MTLKQEQIISMAESGFRPTIIARNLGQPVSTVYSVICAARRKGKAIPHFSTGRLDGPLGQELRFNLPQDTAATLSQEAARRGVTPSRLARELVTAICDDIMFTAILED